MTSNNSNNVNNANSGESGNGADGAIEGVAIEAAAKRHRFGAASSGCE